MKPEAQRIAIAEACGYSRQEPDSVWFDSPSDGQIYVEDLPDYLNDLNAMHEAEKVLTLESGQWRDYELQLRRLLVISGRLVCNTEQEHRLITATAAQRVEAFLKTLNLWQQ